MKKTDTDVAGSIVLEFYGELSESESAKLKEAFDKDPMLAKSAEACASNLSRMQAVPDVAMEAHELERLQRSILRATVEADAHARRPIVAPTLWQQLRDVFATPQRIGFTLAGGLAFIFIGMLIGSNSTLMPGGASAGGAVSMQGSEQSAAAVASNPQIRDFLRRSQIYLATSADEQIACDKCPPIQTQLPNKQIAQQLLKEATMLRAQAGNNPEVKKLITDIEFVLESIGNNREVSPVQAEMVHHIASNAVCEVTARIDTNATHHNVGPHTP